MKTIYRNRLLRLAKHLEKGKLGHKKFDFSTWNEGKTPGSMPARRCGYAGCAIGECPIIWPKAWKFDGYGDPSLTGRHFSDVSTCATEWFGVLLDEVQHLFVPNCQNPRRFGGQTLGNYATRDEVAANLRAFVDKNEL